MHSDISHLTSVCVCACVHVCVFESEWVGVYFCVCVLCVQIQPCACAYASCWQINPGNPDLRRQSEEVRLRIHTHSPLSHTHTHAHIHVLGQLRCQPLWHPLDLRRRLGLLSSRSLMGLRKVLLFHLTTIFLVTASLQWTITPFTIRICNFLVIGRYPRISLNFAILLLPLSSALTMGKDRTKFSSCMCKVLVLTDIFQDLIRARDTLRHLARSLPTLLLLHGFKMIQLVAIVF